MSESPSFAASFFALLRRRLMDFSMVAACSFALVPIFFLMFAGLIYSQAGAGQESPKLLWDAASGWVKSASVLIFLLTLNLPRDLTEAGIAMIVWADERGGRLALRTVLVLMVKALPRLVPLSLLLGFLIVLLGPTLLLPVFLSVAFALVMPLVGTTPLGGFRALHMGFKLSMRGILQLMALYFGSLVVFAPVALLFYLAVRIFSQVEDSALPMRLFLAAFLVFLAAFFMLRSLVLTLIYLRVVRESALERVAERKLEPQEGSVSAAE